MKWIFALLLTAHVMGVEPANPRNVDAAPAGILEISVHQEVTTMIRFPGQVSMISGSGLTDGTREGLVQFDHRKGTDLVTFRALQIEKPVFVQIVSGDTVTMLRLQPGEHPDSVVTIRGAMADGTPEIPREEVVGDRLEISQERLRQFVELARSSNLLSRARPEEYRGYQRIGVNHTLTRGNLDTRIESIHRFPQSDVLVFFGTIRNSGKAVEVLNSRNIHILAGDRRQLDPGWLSLQSGNLRAGEVRRIECVVAGDGKGNRLHLSIRNPFAIICTPNEQQP